MIEKNIEQPNSAAIAAPMIFLCNFTDTTAPYRAQCIYYMERNVNVLGLSYRNLLMQS